MTAPDLTVRETQVLALVRRHGTVAVHSGDSTLATVRALARRGLVDYDRVTGEVRAKNKEPVR